MTILTCDQIGSTLIGYFKHCWRGHMYRSVTILVLMAIRFAAYTQCHINITSNHASFPDLE